MEIGLNYWHANPSETYTSEPSWAYRIDHFEQTAPGKQVWGAAVILGLLVCGLFALLMLMGLTIEDWRAYAVAGPLTALAYFILRRLHHFGHSGFALLLFLFTVLAMGLLCVTSSDAILLYRRGVETETIVTRVENRARAPLACHLERPDGAPVLGTISCGQLRVGDRVTVTIDPIGRVGPMRGSVSPAPDYTAFSAGSGLIMLSVLLGTASGIRKRGTIRRWWPPAEPPRNYGQPSSPFPPPPPPVLRPREPEG
ncbi:hypothetical protein [Streptomyces sp. MAR4 CNX-425]|uniref:hypothetical protein n=1 Tax=Streptomyces sp. MAR4 CNX-425 TaxID=3406343 RepID=UPI003B503C5A